MGERNIGIKGDECVCGRRASVLHCPACGSSRVYARENRKHTMLDGSVKHVDTQFRCQRCGHLFIEEERQFCDAPPVSKKLAEQKARALAQSLLEANPERAHQLIEQGTLVKDFNEELQEIEAEQQHPPTDRKEYDLHMEWVHYNYNHGKPPGGLTVEEYVERRLKGEVIP